MPKSGYQLSQVGPGFPGRLRRKLKRYFSITTAEEFWGWASTQTVPDLLDALDVGSASLQIAIRIAGEIVDPALLAEVDSPQPRFKTGAEVDVRSDAQMTDAEWIAWSALQQNRLAQDILVVISKDLGIAGYGVARKLNRNPEEVLAGLSLLLGAGLISGRAQLRENFTLTAIGFALSQRLSRA